MLAQATVDIPISTPSKGCIDHLPPSALTRVPVYAMVDLPKNVSGDFGVAADNFLQELVLKAHILLAGKPEVLPNGEPTISWQDVDAPLHLTAFRDGRIITRDTTKGTAAALLRQALEQTSTVGFLGGDIDSTRDSVRFDIAFLRPQLDSAGHASNPTFKRTGIALLSVLAPWERSVSQKAGRPPPRYPEEARRAGYQALLFMSFVVDSTGHAIGPTIREVWPQGTPRPTGEDLRMYEEFLESTKRAIPQLEFVPASIGGCRMNQLVQMPFAFELRR